MVHHVVTVFTCLPWLGSGTDRAVSWMGTERKGGWSGGQLILYLMDFSADFFFVLIHFGSLDKINPRSEILAIDRHCCWPLDFWYSICCIDQSLSFWGKLSAAVGQRHFGVHHAWGMWKILTREIIWICPTCCHSAQEGLFSTFHEEVYVCIYLHTYIILSPGDFMHALLAVLITLLVILFGVQRLISDEVSDLVLSTYLRLPIPTFREVSLCFSLSKKTFHYNHLKTYPWIGLNFKSKWV